MYGSYSKRRKIKCDRNMPCDSCIKRGESDTCSWDTTFQPEKWATLPLCTEISSSKNLQDEVCLDGRA